MSCQEFPDRPPELTPLRVQDDLRVRSEVRIQKTLEAASKLLRSPDARLNESKESLEEAGLRNQRLAVRKDRRSLSSART